MAVPSISIAALAEHLNCIAFSFTVEGKYWSPEEIIKSITENAKDSTGTMRYLDFLVLPAKIAKADNWRDFSLQDLFLSVESLENKYDGAASEEAWQDVKFHILLQIYLGVLREAAGVEDDVLPDSLAAFHIPSSVSVDAYRGRVSYLMETYQCDYMQKGQEAGDLHPRYQEHRDTLLRDVVTESVNDSGVVESVLNKEIIYELLQTHHTDIFKRSVVKFIQSVERQALPDPVPVSNTTALESALGKRGSGNLSSGKNGQSIKRQRSVTDEEVALARNKDVTCEANPVCDPSVHLVSPSKANSKDLTSRSSSHNIPHGYHDVAGLSHTHVLSTPSMSITANACDISILQPGPIQGTAAPSASTKGDSSTQEQDAGNDEDREKESEEESDSDNSDDDDEILFAGWDPAWIEHAKELQRRDYHKRCESVFLFAYVEAHDKNELNEETKCRDYTSDAFWTGRGSLSVKGVEHTYTKSRVVKDNGTRRREAGVIATDKGLFIRMENGLWDTGDM